MSQSEGIVTDYWTLGTREWRTPGMAGRYRAKNLSNFKPPVAYFVMLNYTLRCRLSKQKPLSLGLYGGGDYTFVWLVFWPKVQ